MDSLKNKQTAKNRQEEIKKVTTLRAQGGGSSALPPHVSKKTKYSSNLQLSGEGASGSSTHPKAHEFTVDDPRHGVAMGLMTSQGPVAPPPFPLLVKDKEYAMDTARSIVQDADLGECSKHETDPLGDFGLHDMIRVCCISTPFIPFLSLCAIHPFLT